MALVSVIMPCYNQGKYITESIQSVLNSTFKDLELIVVNDGSTDDFTNHLLSKMTWGKTTIYNIENQGVAKARNFAIEKSSGTYILPLDADDKISDDYIRQAVEILEKKPDIKIVTCEVQLFGKKHGRMSLPDSSIEMLLAQNTIVVSSLFRRSDFNNTGGFNPDMVLGFEDWDFWLTLLESGGEVFKLDHTGFYYRIGRKSRNSTIQKEQFTILRKQLYESHQTLYSMHFFDPAKSFEYNLIRNSMEYKVGSLMLKPVRFLMGLFK
jgi:glycosyltransferase involved in cell wall biosynthesis